jgi:hypothetical protein
LADVAAGKGTFRGPPHHVRVPEKSHDRRGLAGTTRSATEALAHLEKFPDPDVSIGGDGRLLFTWRSGDRQFELTVWGDQIKFNLFSLSAEPEYPTPDFPEGLSVWSICVIILDWVHHPEGWINVR